MSHTKNIDPEVVEALKKAAVTETVVSLGTVGSLPAPLYKKCDRALKMLGGKWDRQKAGHFFPRGDAKQKIAEVIGTGKVVDTKKKFQVFFTPPEVVDQMLSFIGDKGIMCSFLEPSAGEGWITRKLFEYGASWVDSVELNPDFIPTLRAVYGLENAGDVNDGNVIEGDFMKLDPDDHTKYDFVIMNPPFAKNQDIRHIAHALRFLVDWGQLVSLTMGEEEGVLDRIDNLFPEMRTMVEDCMELPGGTHRSVGTNIVTTIVSMRADVETIKTMLKM